MYLDISASGPMNIWHMEPPSSSVFEEGETYDIRLLVRAGTATVYCRQHGVDAHLVQIGTVTGTARARAKRDTGRDAADRPRRSRGGSGVQAS